MRGVVSSPQATLTTWSNEHSPGQRPHWPRSPRWAPCSPRPLRPPCSQHHGWLPPDLPVLKGEAIRGHLGPHRAAKGLRATARRTIASAEATLQRGSCTRFRSDPHTAARAGQREAARTGTRGGRRQRGEWAAAQRRSVAKCWLKPWTQSTLPPGLASWVFLRPGLQTVLPGAAAVHGALLAGLRPTAAASVQATFPLSQQVGLRSAP